DVSNAPQSGYLGTVHFSSTDTAAALPADYTFLAGDAGKHTFSVTLKTGGTQTVTVADTSSPGITGTTGQIQNGQTQPEGGPAFLKISIPSGTETTGAPFAVTVSAADNSGATLTSYTGKVHFTSTDAAAVLPADYTFVAGDNGVHSFNV